MMKSILKILFVSMMTTVMITSVKSQENITPVFNHLALSVKNLKEITAFYKDVLLLEQIAEPFKDGKHSWFSLGPGMSLHLIEDAEETNEHPRNNHLCVSIADMDDYINHLDDKKVRYYNSKGTPQVKQTRPDGVQQIYVVDPEGHWIEINDEVGKK